MGSVNIIMVMIGVCAILLAFMLVERPLRLLLRMAAGGAAGVLGMLSANILLAPFGLFVGINIATVLVVGLLGLPGFVTLYIASYLLDLF